MQKQTASDMKKKAELSKRTTDRFNPETKDPGCLMASSKSSLDLHEVPSIVNNWLDQSRARSLVNENTFAFEGKIPVIKIGNLDEKLDTSPNNMLLQELTPISE